MLNQKTSLLVKIGERVYELMCTPDSPLGELHDALCQMKAYIVQRINDISASEQPKPAEPTDAEVEIIPKQGS